jgi:hypothetical protein
MPCSVAFRLVGRSRMAIINTLVCWLDGSEPVHWYRSNRDLASAKNNSPFGPDLVAAIRPVATQGPLSSWLSAQLVRSAYTGFKSPPDKPVCCFFVCCVHLFAGVH